MVERREEAFFSSSCAKASKAKSSAEGEASILLLVVCLRRAVKGVPEPIFQG